eukprot:gene9457-biopygen2172
MGVGGSRVLSITLFYDWIGCRQQGYFHNGAPSRAPVDKAVPQLTLREEYTRWYRDLGPHPRSVYPRSLEWEIQMEMWEVPCVSGVNVHRRHPHAGRCRGGSPLIMLTFVGAHTKCTGIPGERRFGELAIGDRQVLWSKYGGLKLGA